MTLFMVIFWWVVLTGTAWYFILKYEKGKAPNRRDRGDATFQMTAAAMVAAMGSVLLSLSYWIPVILGSLIAVGYGAWRLMNWAYNRFV